MKKKIEFRSGFHTQNVWVPDIGFLVSYPHFVGFGVGMKPKPKLFWVSMYDLDRKRCFNLFLFF